MISEGCVSVQRKHPILCITMTVIYPEPLVTREALEQHVIHFIESNPQGVRSCEVGRAIGVNDKTQWFSYDVLIRMVRKGKIRKNNESLYFVVTQN